MRHAHSMSPSERLAAHCEYAAKVVGTWPAWKRNILRHSSSPTTARREPVDNSSHSWMCWGASRINQQEKEGGAS